MGATTDNAQMVSIEQMAGAINQNDPHQQNNPYAACENQSISNMAGSIGGNGGYGSNGNDAYGGNGYGYYSDLYKITSQAATAAASTPHSMLDGASCGNIHSSPYTSSQNPSSWHERNSLYDSAIPQHSNTVVVNYQSDIPTGDSHRFGDPGRWITNAPGAADWSGQQARENLSMPQTPRHAYEADVATGTNMEWSRTQAGYPQTRIRDRVKSSFFKNKRDV